jgi:hypothetical protein
MATPLPQDDTKIIPFARDTIRNMPDPAKNALNAMGALQVVLFLAL